MNSHRGGFYGFETHEGYASERKEGGGKGKERRKMGINLKGT